MKIGVTQIILGGMSLDDTLSLCQDAGYDAVELTFGEGKDTDINMSDTELGGIAAKCEAAGIEIGSITAGYADRGNLLSLDANAARKRGGLSRSWFGSRGRTRCRRDSICTPVNSLLRGHIKKFGITSSVS